VKCSAAATSIPSSLLIPSAFVPLRVVAKKFLQLIVRRSIRMELRAQFTF
jgi:hypothetical protein